MPARQTIRILLAAALACAAAKGDVYTSAAIALIEHLRKSTTDKPAAQDPFANLADAPKASTLEPASIRKAGFFKNLVTENFGFRKEIMSQFDATEQGRPASRQSVGFEVQKKFSTATATVASFDFQARLVRRDGFNPVLNDMEGERRPGWAFEYHNLFLDLYNIFNPLLTEAQRGENVGRFNLRIGRFYVPFGLNTQTDTHGTVLQLSNDRNFGFERDWYTGFWGSINQHLNYDAYYLAGSGYGLKFKGQSGLGSLRLSLSNKYSSAYGIEAGFSILGGERLAVENPQQRISTQRAGLDGRYRHTVPTGLLTFTSELSRGRDFPDRVHMQLHQVEYLHASRRWSLATQYRRFWQSSLGADASIIAEATCYLRNDVGNSNLHWIKLNIERKTERQTGQMMQRPGTVVTLQYYFYR
jgi:hypothetical protein